ncbi:hypothetical protein GOODEAATRI_030815, partial [Goodea atripinnis]
YSVDRGSDTEHFFDIDSNSGAIRTSRYLDREIRVLHNITVIGTETCMLHDLVGSAFVLISVADVNDNAPSFAGDYWTSVCENVLPGQRVNFVMTLPIPLLTDNTASVLTLQSGFLRRDQPVHFLPVVIADGGSPSLSSTNTLTITICDCDLHGNHRHCSQEEPWHGGMGTTTAITLTCALTFLGMRREPQMMDDQQDIQENIVCYDDEGGGEADTKAFDMFALRHLNQMNLTGGCGTAEPETMTQKTRLLQEFIGKRLQEVDLDPTVPPLDSLQIYAFEGSGSAAHSLSSLSSVNSLESEQNFSKAVGSKVQEAHRTL